MNAILIKEFGDPDQLMLGTFPTPTCEANGILVRVKATALNRADTLQRKGMYPPPPGASPILGLEMAGEIESVGSAVTKWEPGDRVCGLLEGGGYAEFATIHEEKAIRIPEAWSWEEAAAIPEVFLTAFQALVLLSKLQPGERILIHAGASGVGTAAIQLAKALGAAQIIITASASKHNICKSLGAEIAIDYRSQNFETIVHEVTEGKGVNIIIDFLAAPYFQKNINSLAMDGRMVMLALMGGVKADQINLANILRKRLHIMGSTLRARSLEYKIELVRQFSEFALPRFAAGELKPVIDSVFDWKDVSDAHRYMESNQNKGKIVLKVS